MHQLPSLCTMVLLYITSHNVLCMQSQHHSKHTATHQLYMYHCIYNCQYTVQGYEPIYSLRTALHCVHF